MTRSFLYHSKSSLRRRRLVIQLTRPSNDVPVEADSDKQIAVPESRSVPVTVPELLAMLRSTPSITWLFTGDTLPLPGQPSERNSHVAALTHAIRDELGRYDDAFISSEAPRLRLRELLDNFDQRIGRFAPQIVIVSCGVEELRATGESSLAFERMFHELIERIRGAGAVAVINTPPRADMGEGIEHADELIRLEAIRACTAESPALLVDHWDHWEQSSEPHWLAADGQSLSHSGAKAFADEFIRELQLDELKQQISEFDEPMPVQ